MLTKLCKACGTNKPLDKFRKHGLTCRQCLHKQDKEANKDRIRKWKRRHRIKESLRLQVMVVDYLGGRCENLDCLLPNGGKSLPPCVFDFHHKDPATKIATISMLISNFVRKKNLISTERITEQMILEEANKCQLLCCVCHRITHMKSLSNIDFLTYD